MTAERHPGEGAPPPGAPWDSPIAETPFAFVDLEMTGLVVGVDRVVEVCIERVRGGVLEARVDALLDPEGKRGNEKIHGLDDATLAGKPGFPSIADHVVRALDGAIFVAHGATWDLAFLRDELGRVGLAERLSAFAIDTLVLSRRAFHLHSHALGKVAASLGIVVERAHRATDDVATMRAVFEKILLALAPTSARDLWETRVHTRAARAHIVEGLEGALARGGPVDVVYRPARRGEERLTFVVTSLGAGHVIGYLLPGRGRRELRIDRILRVELTPL